MAESSPLLKQDESSLELNDHLTDKSIENKHQGENLSDFETFFNISNGIMGTGLLAMGFVFRCAGLWALLIVPVIAISGNYTGKLLVRLLYDVDENGERHRTRQGYLDIGEAFLPYFGKFFINVVNIIENFAHAILILLMAGGVMNEVIPAITDDIWTVICAAPLLAVIFLQRIRSLSKVAMATVTMGTTLVIIATVYSLRFSDRWGRTMATAKLFDIKKFTLAIGITIVTYACQPYLPFIEKDMRNRANFDKLMNISYASVTLFKMVSGFLVYLAYEKLTHPLMTLDLPSGPLRTVSSLFLLIVALTFFIFPMFTVFDIVDQNWPVGKDGNGPSCRMRYFVRSVLLALAVMIAVVTPHFGLGIALVGNFTATILIFTMPCACDIKFNYPNLSPRELFIDILILVISTVSGIIGIVFSSMELFKSFSDEDLNPTEPLEHL
eukprot:Seg1977.5 transcript_id=Seg1977.5/GoldUCD/mRNA.D3Y31 product="Vesicular inhibitory amino acid transporter" protein_id=Seg1977.5/GoldUCD/D3Y31